MNSGIRRNLKRSFLVISGALLMALNFNLFVYPANLFPGGFSSVALLIQTCFSEFLGIKLPYSVLVYALNAVPAWICFKFVGKKFTFFSVIMILISGFFTDFFRENMAVHITDDMLLSSVFGGIINAAATSLCLFADASTGGTDFIAISISEKTGKSSFNIIFVFNCLILTVAGILFGWDKALYSIIFQFASTQMLKIMYKKYSKTTLLVITDRSDDVYSEIKNLTNHGATVFEGRGNFSGKVHQLVYTVVSSEEATPLEKQIRKIDPHAFINIIRSEDILGQFYRKLHD